MEYLMLSPSRSDPDIKDQVDVHVEDDSINYYSKVPNFSQAKRREVKGHPRKVLLGAHLPLITAQTSRQTSEQFASPHYAMFAISCLLASLDILNERTDSGLIFQSASCFKVQPAPFSIVICCPWALEVDQPSGSSVGS
jgi:hypothetical protein